MAATMYKYRRNYRIRAACQTIAFACLVGGFLLHHRLFQNYDEEGSPSTGTFSTRNLKDDSIVCKEKDTADPEWLLVFYFIGVMYMFLAIAICCDEFFVPALEEMSSERHLHLSTDVAGATLMAAGGSAPEFFSNMFGTFAADDTAIGFGTIVGSAVFNVLFVIAMCSLFAKEMLDLTWWPLFRDSVYYAVGLAILAIFFGVTTPGKIDWWEATVLFALYFGYIILMYFNRAIYWKLTGRELEYPDEPDRDEGGASAAGGAEESMRDTEDHLPRRDLGAHTTGISQLSLMSGRSQLSIISGSSLILDEDLPVVRRRRHGTFRAGILKLLRDPDSWIDTAGIGIVAKIAGDADHVFHRIDLNNDGFIDRHELEHLFERLDCHLSDEELNQVFDSLDENKDGKISAREFNNWYVSSKERILSRVKEVFDSFDIDHSGTIDRTKLKMILEQLYPRVTDEDVEQAITDMYQSGSREEITFDEFSAWYQESLIYERQRRAVEEDMEGVWESLKPPQDGGALAWLKYLIVLPLVAVMTFTVPDTQRPGMSKWCYVSFALSIVWIGVFAYLMVIWTEIIGATIGIPSVVMGYTLLAAGTSVPDLLSSVIVARRGYGDMAVSSSIGSNIFDILVGLPVPWLLYIVWPTKPDSIDIGSDNILISVLVLLAMLVFVIVTVHCQGWKLTKILAVMMLLFYFGFLAQAIVLELPFEGCIL